MKNVIAAAIFARNNKFLLEKRKETEDNYAGLWTFPGGHREKSEAIEKTLVREMKEELGVEIKEYELIDVFKDIDPTSKEPYEHHVFLCKKWKGRIKKTAEEEKVEWMELDEIPKLKKVTKAALRGAKILRRIF